jgi:prepilin-type N-terminal cleavage/methylation domain-containing protein
MIRQRSNASGFTLIEVLIAMGLFVVIAIGIAQLSATATRAARTTRERTMAVILAAGKLDELRALDFTYEPPIAGDPPRPRTDLVTNLSRSDFARDGPGLAASPPGTLIANVPPYVDYRDDEGRWVGNGSAPPRGAVFIRRWSVQPLPEDPNHVLILRAIVTTVRSEGSRSGAGSMRAMEAVLTTMRTRTR